MNQSFDMIKFYLKHLISYAVGNCAILSLVNLHLVAQNVSHIDFQQSLMILISNAVSKLIKKALVNFPGLRVVILAQSAE